MSWRAISACARYRNEAIIIAISVAAFLIVWPVGEYPILDDWAFVKSLEHLHYHGKLVVLDWNPMSLTGHLVWGLMFTKVLGFSFLSTKVAVFCAGVLLSLIVFWFARRHGANPEWALLAALGLLLNPLFLVHIFMFMTDVTGLVWQWLSIWCLSLGLAGSHRRRQLLLVASSVCWAFAFLTRQHGIAVPLALACYIVLFDRSLLSLKFVVPAFLPGVWLTINGLYLHAQVQPNNQSFQVSTDLVKSFVTSPPWESLPFIFWTYAVYVGLFVAPVVFSIRANGSLRFSRGLNLVLAPVTAFGVMYWTHACLNNWYFPYCRNVVTPFGMFQSNEFVIWNRPLMWDRELGMAVGLFGLVAALVWLLLLGNGWVVLRESAARTDPRSFGCRFLLLLLGFQLAYVVATSPILFDRHLLLLAPTSILLVALFMPPGVRPRWVAASFPLIGYAAYGVICSHDIHAASRAVFLEGNRLMAAGISPQRIDAGYAFDGWYMYEKSQVISRAPAVWLPPWWPQPGYSGQEFEQPWWIYSLVSAIEPEYVVTASSAVPVTMFRGKYVFEESDSPIRYWTYWPFGEQKVRVFRDVSTKMQPPP